VNARGVSLVELTVVLGASLVVGSMAAPLLGRQADDISARGAARHVATVLQDARTDAIRRGVSVAIRFQLQAGQIRFATFADGNSNGVRTTDIAKGTDPQISAWDDIGSQFTGVSISIAPGVTDIDSGAPLTGDPVRIGSTELLSFSARGAATAGTVYLRGRTDEQYAVRVAGATGRVRLLHFVKGSRQWVLP